MKKHIFFVAAMLISLATSAQSKGDHYVAWSLSANGGIQKATVSEKGTSVSQSDSEPLDEAYLVSGEFGVFVKDNFRASLSLGVGLNASPISEESWGWCKNRTLSFALNPNIAYYKRLADNLYYTPEIGVSFERGTVRTQTSMTKAEVTPIWGWNAYVYPIALEFRATERVALGAIIGSLNYGKATIEEEYYGSTISLVASQFKYNLNQSCIVVRLYY